MEKVFSGIQTSESGESGETELEASFQQFMDGEAHQNGGRYDETRRGLTTDPHQPDMSRFGEGVQITPEATVLNTEPGVPRQPAQPEQDFRRMYGQSENEKGQWRRTAEEAIQELQRVRGELEQLRMLGPTQPQQYPGYPPFPVQPPAYSPYVGLQQSGIPTTMPQQIPQNQAEPNNYFKGREQEEPLTVADMNNVLDRVAMVMDNMGNQILGVYMTQLQAQKAAAGITPMLERQLLMTYPWLSQYAEGPGRIQAMQDLMRVHAGARQPQQQQAGGQTVAPMSPAVAAAAAPATRRVTYVEPSTGQPVMSDGGRTTGQALAEEFRAAKTSAEQRAVLEKMGIRRVNDLGQDVLVR